MNSPWHGASVRATVEFEYGSSTAAARALIDAAVPLARLDPAAASSMLSTVAGLVSLAGDRDLAGEAIAALDTLPSPADPAVVVTVTVARAMARQIADDPEGALRLLNEIDDAEWAEMGAKGPPRSRLLAAQAAAMRGDDAKTYALAAAQVAEAPFSRFRRWSAHARQPWAMAVAERCRALISTPEEAEARYVTAVRLHSGSGRPFEEARTRLLYGEWLRRDLRRTEARSHLRAALDTFERLEAAPWIDRARNELRATGEIAPPPRLDRLSRLTPQELQVIRLAATGATNREIGGRLFLSPRTVSYHLYKAYPKLGVSSRRELVDLDLDRALVDNPRSVPR